MITIQNETEIEESTPIGTKVLYFRVEDTDLNDNITFTLSGDSELFVISEVQYEKGKDLTTAYFSYTNQHGYIFKT